MAGKERWRKLINALDLDSFPKAMLNCGLQEIHHINNKMDGRMDACLGFSAILTAEAFDSVGEVQVSIQDLQKRLANKGWERMCLKREFEDKLRESQLEVANLKYRVSCLKSVVDKLVNPPHDPPCEAIFRVASPLPDIGLPSDNVPGLDFDMLEVDWDEFHQTWPSGVGYRDAEGESDKENEWTAVLIEE